jgi:hypothetical protein
VRNAHIKGLGRFGALCFPRGISISAKEMNVIEANVDNAVCVFAPTKADKVPVGPERPHEIKHDGWRMMVIREQDRVRLISIIAEYEQGEIAVLRFLNLYFIDSNGANKS